MIAFGGVMVVGAAVTLLTISEPALGTTEPLFETVSAFGAPDTLASWAVDAIPATDAPAITVRTERGLITTGRWRRADTDDLIVIADRPTAAKPSVRLSEALHGLVPLLDDAAAPDADEV